jgi:virulence-associated protein VagC
MTRTTVFQSNRSQAVRLPKDVAFPEGVREVNVLRDGKRRVIVPSGMIFSRLPALILASVTSRRHKCGTGFDAASLYAGH